uniref:Uncharacterized protein n=1 Tax=Arundo donax TaxID=35708 RepID=A0A0A9AHG5_ARUDO
MVNYHYRAIQLSIANG